MNEQRKNEKKEDNLVKGKKTVDKSTQKKELILVLRLEMELFYLY